MARKITNLNNPKSFIFKGLIEQICSGEYILMLGSEIIMDKNVVPSADGDSTKYLLQNVIESRKELGYHYSLGENDNFMDFIISNGLDVNIVKQWVLKEIEKNLDFKIEEVSPYLRHLISTKLFRVILTTTIDPYLEKVMEEVWGKDGFRIMNIYGNVSSDKFDFSNDDIRGNEYYDVKPTLYYVFGKADPFTRDSKFALTDDDTMKAITQWLTYPPSTLMSYINEKKIMAIGCKLSDWCFRFFWHAMRRFAVSGEQNPMQLGDIALILNTEKSEIDKNLHKYLDKAVRIHVENNSHSFIKELAEKLSERELAEAAMKSSSLGGIFLSYSNDDFSTACNIFNRLREANFNVWFDNEKISTGDKYDIRIFNAIQQAKIFVPILSLNVAKDLEEDKDKYYRKEWEIASGVNNDLKIMPIILPGYDLKGSYHSKTPNKIRESSMFDWSKKTFSTFIDDIKNNLK